MTRKFASATFASYEMRQIDVCCDGDIALEKGAVTGESMPQTKFNFCIQGYATRADRAQLRDSAQPNAVGHAEPALFLGLGAAR